MAASDAAGKTVGKVVIGAGVAVGGWLLSKVGDKAADKGIEKGTQAASKHSDDRHQRGLAQDLARQRGWRYTHGTIVDHKRRYIVWDDDKRPMAAYPKVDGVETPEQPAERFELKGYTPSDDEFLVPPEKKKRKH